MTAPRRRWSFSLRMMFVVTALLGLPLGWLAYQLNWIRERHFAIAKPIVSHVWFGDPGGTVTDGSYKVAPWPLNRFGENGVISITFRQEPTQGERRRYYRLFPESSFSVE